MRTLARLWTVCCKTGPREEGHPEADMPKPLSDHRAPIEIKDPVSERIDRTIESHIREVVPAEVISAREAVDKAGLADVNRKQLDITPRISVSLSTFGFSRSR